MDHISSVDFALLRLDPWVSKMPLGEGEISTSWMSQAGLLMCRGHWGARGLGRVIGGGPGTCERGVHSCQSRPGCLLWVPGRGGNINSGQGSAVLGLRAWFTGRGAHIPLLLHVLPKTLETQILWAFNKLSDCLKNVAHEANLTRSIETMDHRWRALRWWWWIYRKGLANGGLPWLMLCSWSIRGVLSPWLWSWPPKKPRPSHCLLRYGANDFLVWTHTRQLDPVLHTQPVRKHYSVGIDGKQQPRSTIIKAQEPQINNGSPRRANLVVIYKLLGRPVIAKKICFTFLLLFRLAPQSVLAEKIVIVMLKPQ